MQLRGVSFGLLALLALPALAGCGAGAGAGAGLPLAPGATSDSALRALPGERFIRYIPATGIDGDLLSITVGPDGALWFTETSSGAIGRVDVTGHVTSYPVSPSAGVPVAITSGPDGNLWFTLGGGSQQGIGRITPAGAISVFPFGKAFDTELDITAGPDGNLWFTDFDNNMVGKVTTQGVVTEYPIPNIGAPIGITLGPDKKLWICEEGALQGNNNVPGRMLRMTTTLKFKAFPLQPMSWTTAPQFVAKGPDGNLWFTEMEQTATPFNIESITPTGTIAKYPLPASAEPPYRIASASSGSLWFTEQETYVDQVTTGGVITRYAMPQPPGTSLPPQPRGIAFGPRRDLWWVETSSGSIGVLRP